MASIFRFISYLYSWLYTSYILHKNLSSFWNCFILKLKITLFYFLSFVFHSLYHSLSFTVTHCHFLSLVAILCHSFSFVLPLVVTRCHSLSLVVIRCFTRCHSFYHSLPVIRCHSLSFVATRCTLRPATLLKKSLWHRCFSVNFAKFLRTAFFAEHLQWLLLVSGNSCGIIFNWPRAILLYHKFQW